MNEEVQFKWDQFLDPTVMRPRLISASIYIAAYQSLRSCIVDRVREFYWNGFDENGEKISPEYTTKVLTRNKSPVFASLDWFREMGAIEPADVAAFERVTKCRNVLSHELLDMLGTKGLPEDFNQCFADVVALLRKIEVWWIVNVEIPINPDYDGQEIDEAGIMPGRIMALYMLLDIALGPDEESRRYVDEFRKQAGAAKSPGAKARA